MLSIEDAIKLLFQTGGLPNYVTRVYIGGAKSSAAVPFVRIVPLGHSTDIFCGPDGEYIDYYQVQISAVHDTIKQAYTILNEFDKAHGGDNFATVIEGTVFSFHRTGGNRVQLKSGKWQCWYEYDVWVESLNPTELNPTEMDL